MTAATPPHDAAETLRVGFLTLPNYSMIAFSNAVEPLRMANRLSRDARLTWTTLSITGEAMRASNGLAVVPTIAAAESGALDMLFVCGGVDIGEAYDEATLAYLRRVARENKLGALCTGSYVLARAGLLDGYRCAIHWENMAAVRDEFPNVGFSSELFVIDRDRYTASGGTAPLDLMLNLIADRRGTELAVAISEEFIHERIREPRDQQRIPLLARVGPGQQKIIAAASLMEAHADEPLSLDEVARRVGLSRRHLERLFRQHLDRHPARYYRELRLNRARQLLLQTNLSVTEITVACGFQSPGHFSTCYKALFGRPPSTERRLTTSRQALPAGDRHEVIVAAARLPDLLSRSLAMEEPSPDQSRRRGGGRGRTRAQGGGEVAPRTQPRLVYAPTEAVSADALEAIHLASLTVLEEIGIDFLHDGAREILKAAGADAPAGSNRVRFDRALVESQLGKAPPQFTLHGRNPARNVEIGGNFIAFCSVASAPNAADRDGGRRSGNRADYQNFIRLGQMLEAVHVWGGYPVEPIDVHASIRHLDAIYDLLTLSDKPIHAYSLGRGRNLDAIEMTRIARGIDDATLDREPSVFTVINSSSPLRIDTPMLEGIIQMARRNQPIVMTPFTLAGAMAPVSIAGALAQQNAEALAGLVLTQLVNPGAPFVYGGFTSNVDMKSGAPAFGTPEYMKSALVGGQLARRYSLPYRSSNANAANTVDAQAAYESVFSLWGAIMGGTNLLMHGAGWMEGGLHASFEKMVLDADLLGMVAEFLRPVVVNDAELALDAMREVGPGGHFFGAAHTMARYRGAFYAPMISDWRNFETWKEAGRPDAYDAANRLYKTTLAGYEAPPMDPAALEELTAFVARRKAEGGVPTDF